MGRLSRCTGPEMNESRTSKFYFARRENELVTCFLFIFCCFFCFCVVLFFSSTEYTKKRGREGVSEKCTEEKAKRKLHISNYTSSFIILGKRP